MNIALFTKCFLEPTHVAIAQVVQGLCAYKFHVVAKAFHSIPCFKFNNVVQSKNYEQKCDIEDTVASCDVVHAIYDGHIAFDAYQLAQKLQKPFILSFHGGFDTNAKINKPSVREMTRAITELADAVTVVAVSDIHRLRAIGVTRQIEVVSVPVDFSVLPRSANKNLQSLIAIGRLIPKKGFDTAIECLSYLPAQFRLQIIGSGPEINELQRIVCLCGLGSRVEFTGFLPLPEMLTKLSMAGVLIHPARVAQDGNAEGIPQVVLWAQALGIPVICGDSGSVCDAVRQGDTGYLIPPNDPKSLAKAITEVTASPAVRESIIENARSQVMTRNSLPLVNEHWRNLYTAVSCKKKQLPHRADPLEILFRQRPDRFRKALEAGRLAVHEGGAECTLIESGGQGVVLLATKQSKPPLVLKVANILTDNPEEADIAQHRIKREGDILSELCRRRCKDVPSLHYLDHEGRFLVRDYCSGSTLQEAVLGLSPAERSSLLPVLIAFCRRLADVFHRSGRVPFVIRDFKPKNVIVQDSKYQRFMLIDVGSVRISGHRPKVPQSKIRLGSRNWLHWSPELLKSQGTQADERSDYFSFGATAFYLLTGRPPFSNSEPDPLLVLNQYMKEYDSIKKEWHAVCRKLQVPIQIEYNISTWLHPIPEHRITGMAEI